VALGRAMVRRPDIFLMDEPLSNLDAKLRVTMRGELRRFHLDLNATTIYVTHDQLEAMTMSDLIAVMHGGIVQQFGTPAEVYDSPANLFVAGFIGSPPMNFMRGTLLASHTQVAFMGPDLTIPLSGLQDGAAGREVVLGVRPQDLELVGEEDTLTARGRVWVVELVGSEKLVEVELGERRRVTVQARADRPVHVDEPVGVRVDPKRVHIFDAREGHALRRNTVHRVG
jgi:ABC-type sugar transport system ATPase subunit